MLCSVSFLAVFVKDPTPVRRCASALPRTGAWSDRGGSLQSPAGSGPQLLPSQGQVQCEQSRQHDHPVHCSARPVGQGHQPLLHARAVGWLDMCAPLCVLSCVVRFTNEGNAPEKKNCFNDL